MIVDVLAALFFGSLVGHGVHYALHQPWSGRAHKGHMEHHEVLYPPSKLVSATYRAPNFWNSGTFLFTPPLLGVMAVALLLGASVTFCITLVAWAFLNDMVHDAFHVNKPPLQRWKWYRTMRHRHFHHHREMQSNYGIVTNVWDRVFHSLRLNKSR